MLFFSLFIQFFFALELFLYNLWKMKEKEWWRTTFLNLSRGKCNFRCAHFFNFVLNFLPVNIFIITQYQTFLGSCNPKNNFSAWFPFIILNNLYSFSWDFLWHINDIFRSFDTFWPNFPSVNWTLPSISYTIYQYIS